MTSSRDSMIIVVFTGLRAKTVKNGTNRYARGQQQYTAKKSKEGKVEGAARAECRGERGGSVARRAVHE